MGIFNLYLKIEINIITYYIDQKPFVSTCYFYIDVANMDSCNKKQMSHVGQNIVYDTTQSIIQGIQYTRLSI